MPYFLDGNNLIGGARGVSRPSDEDRSALVAELAERLRRTKAQVFLFFDGAGERRATLGSLSIRGSAGENADEAIVAEILRSGAPQEIIVVTADRELSRRARNLGAKTLPPAEFWNRVGAPASDRDRRGEPAVDVDEWIRYFEDPRNRGR